MINLKIMPSFRKDRLLQTNGSHQEENCLRTCAKCADSHHPARAQSFIWPLFSIHIFCSIQWFNDSVSGQRWPWSDCADAQSDLGLRCPYARRHVFCCCFLLLLFCFVSFVFFLFFFCFFLLFFFLFCFFCCCFFVLCLFVLCLFVFLFVCFLGFFFCFFLCVFFFFFFAWPGYKQY